MPTRARGGAIRPSSNNMYDIESPHSVDRNRNHRRQGEDDGDNRRLRHGRSPRGDASFAFAYNHMVDEDEDQNP